jgi:hypothetical protein
MILHPESEAKDYRHLFCAGKAIILATSARQKTIEHRICGPATLYTMPVSLPRTTNAIESQQLRGVKLLPIAARNTPIDCQWDGHRERRYKHGVNHDKVYHGYHQGKAEQLREIGQSYWQSSCYIPLRQIAEIWHRYRTLQ